MASPYQGDAYRAPDTSPLWQSGSSRVMYVAPDAVHPAPAPLVSSGSPPSLPIRQVGFAGDGAQRQEDTTDSEDSEEAPGNPSLVRRVSAQVMGWGAAARVGSRTRNLQEHARNSQHSRNGGLAHPMVELEERGMSRAEANAQVVAEHRNEVLFATYSKYIVCFGVFAMFLSVLILALASWHVAMFIQYHDVRCRGSLKLLTKIIISISLFDIVMGTRVCCVELDDLRLPRQWKCKDCCVLLLLAVMVVNIWIILWLSQASQNGDKADLRPYEELPPCQEAAPALYTATMAHGVGLIVYTLYLMVSFVGVGSMLEALLARGLLTSREAAPKGCLESSTVSPDAEQLEEDYECPICLEDVDEETAVMTKESATTSSIAPA
ncbi:unnamed protein product [Effrenium voratum]|nr:unnamed protein product [Effrenium voratum]